MYALKSRKHFHLLFAALLLLIITISVIASSFVYLIFHRRYHETITNNLYLTGESIANTIDNDFFQRTLVLSSDLQTNGVYDPLHTFSITLPGLERSDLLKRLRSAASANDMYSDVLLYYPDENVIMGHYSGIHTLNLRQNRKTCSRLIDLLQEAESGADIRWSIMADDRFPPATQPSVTLISRMKFWTERQAAPLAVFVLNTAKLREALSAYATDGIILSLYENTGSLFLCTSDSPAPGILASLPDDAQLNWSDDSFAHVRFLIGQTGFSLVLSTGLSHYADTTKPMLLFVIMFNLVIFVIGIWISYRLADTFYSPLRQLTDAVADMYSDAAADLPAVSEQRLILSAFDAIHKKLMDMGRMFEANLPSMRRMALHDLFANSQAVHEHTPQVLETARIHLPHAAYCVVALRIFKPDLDNLDESERRIAPYELIDRLESLSGGSCAVYGYDETEKLLFLLNADEPAMAAALERVLDALNIYMEEKGMRICVVHSSPLTDLAEVSYAAQTLEERFSDHFFDEPGADPALPDVKALHEKIIDAVRQQKWDELQALLDEFVSILSGCLRSDTLMLMRQLGLTLLSHLPEATVLSRTENEQILNLLLSPQQVLWRIREYPHALREGLERIARKHVKPVCEESELKEQVRAYLLEHMSEAVSRDDLAAALHFNSSYFSTLFKKQCNVSVSQYIISVKMEYAVSQLLNTLHSVAEISEQIGFSSPQYFIRKFRDQYGLTPLEFRKMQMKG